MSNLDAWRLDIERRLSPRTVAEYGRDVGALADYADVRLDGLEHGEIQRWLEARGGDAKSFARRYSALRSYYGFLVRSERRDGNPMDRVDRPRIRRGSPQTIPDPHHRIAKLDEPYRWVAELIYETGMTKGEAFALDVRGPRLGDEILVGGRPVQLTDPARRAIRALGGRIPRDNGMSPRSVKRRFRQSGLSARGLRHTFADELAEQGADLETIAEALGESRIGATVRARHRPDEGSCARGARAADSSPLTWSARYGTNGIGTQSAPFRVASIGQFDLRGSRIPRTSHGPSHIHAATSRPRREGRCLMSRASKGTTQEHFEAPGFEGHYAELDGYTIGFEKYSAEHELAPLFVGLPNDGSQCRHGGRAEGQGRVPVRGRHRGDDRGRRGVSIRPGHTPGFYPDTEVVEFSPTEQMQQTIEVVTKKHGDRAGLGGLGGLVPQARTADDAGVSLAIHLLGAPSVGN